MINKKDARILLLIVDMIKGFINVGMMSDSSIAKIIPKQKRLIEKMLSEDQVVGFIKDEHHYQSREFLRYPIHCVKNSVESELVDELKVYQDQALIYHKNSTSAIFNKNLLSDIEEMTNLEEVMITGCCTDICVLNLAIPLQNYFDEIDRLVKVTVIKDAVETYHSNQHRRNEYNRIAFMLMKQAGVNLFESNEVL